MDEEGLIREDLNLDTNNDPVHEKIKEDFFANKNIVISILKSMQKEKIISYKETEN
jgi:hypothetical protein